MEQTKMERMKELVDQLNAASLAYYQESSEIMSNYDYDKLYDELLNLEKETGIVPVSYTHLDVYKRQRQERSSMRRAWA